MSLLESLLNTISVALNLGADDRVFETLAADIRGMCSERSNKTARVKARYCSVGRVASQGI